MGGHGDAHPDSHEDGSNMAGVKQLPLMASPVVSEENSDSSSTVRDVDSLQDVEAMGFRYDTKLIPQFEKHSTATLLEIFYDLWVVAVLSVFMGDHSVTDLPKLWSYIGFISIVWFNWFLVGCFDVRFVTDSIFERIARTAHLGVLVGFSVVGPYYSPEDQTRGTFQAFSFILMVSRLVLVGEYLTILWHIRNFKQGKIPLAIAIGFHFIAAIIYLGIAFRFEDGHNSHAYIAWYIIMALEAAIQLGLSLTSKVLSFKGTHLTERMNIFTIIILGEGIMVIMDGVLQIVKNNGWTTPTIGVLVSAICTVYFVFMIYSDWMQSHHHLTGLRQSLWAILHFPFHLCLLLFIKGSTQFLTWWKIIEVQNITLEKFLSVLETVGEDEETWTSEKVVVLVQGLVDQVWAQYKPTYDITYSAVQLVMDDIADFPDSAWNSEDPGDDLITRFVGDAQDLVVTISDSLLVNFKIDPFADMQIADGTDARDVMYTAFNDTSERFQLVYRYVYSTAGIVLITMTILFLIIKPFSPRNTKIYHYIRLTVFFLMGIGLSLVTLVNLNEDTSNAYLNSPWLLPTLCLAYCVVLLLTHLPNPPPLVVFSRIPNPFKRAKGGAEASTAGMQLMGRETDSNNGWQPKSGYLN